MPAPCTLTADPCLLPLSSHKQPFRRCLIVAEAPAAVQQSHEGIDHCQSPGYLALCAEELWANFLRSTSGMHRWTGRGNRERGKRPEGGLGGPCKCDAGPDWTSSLKRAFTFPILHRCGMLLQRRRPCPRYLNTDATGGGGIPDPRRTRGATRDPDK